MVATREELRAKTRQRLSPRTHPTLVRPRRIHVPTPRAAAATDAVWNYEVTTNPGASESHARPLERGGAQIEFRGPRDVTGQTLHELALKFLRRRGPDFLPSGKQLVITLDARGRQRVLERA